MLEPKQYTSLKQLKWFIMGHSQIAQLLYNHWQCNGTLHTRERGTYTEVDSVTKREMLIRRTCNIKALRLHKLLYIAIRRCQPGKDHRAFWKRYSCNVHRSL